MDAPLPLVSIVVRTTGDRPEWLLAALRSIDRQTYPRIEVLLVWSAPGQDRMHDFLARLPEVGSKREEWVRPVYLGRENKSLAASWGARTAEGEFLGFLDDDDVYRPWHVERLAQTLIAERDAGGAYSDVAEVWCNDRTNEPEEPGFQHGGTITLEALYSRPRPSNAFLFRRSVFSRVKFRQELATLEMHDALLRILGPLGTRLVYVPGIGAEFRRREDGSNASEIERGIRKKILGELRVRYEGRVTQGGAP